MEILELKNTTQLMKLWKTQIMNCLAEFNSKLDTAVMAGEQENKSLKSNQTQV
jgi:hypothetical protein